MGSINIYVPGNIKLEYIIENTEVIEKIIQIIKGAAIKKKRKKMDTNDDIVGIWEDRFPGKLSSGTIQKNIRAETWKRF